MFEEPHRKWILIVDDDASVRTMLARVLSEEGYGVLTAANGTDAFGLADTLSVNLVLLDLNMPQVNGWQLLKQFRDNKLSPPVVLITAMPNQQAGAREAGVVAVLEKPLDFPRLLQTVSEAINASVKESHSHE